MQSLLHERRGVLAEPPFKLAPPDIRRGVGVVAQPAEDLEEMPVALELVVVVAMRGLQQVERLGVVRLRLHLGAQRLVDLEAVAVVEVRAFRKATRVIRVAPQQHTRRAAVPQPPVHLVALRVAEQVGVAVPAVELVLRVDVRGMERQAHLLHPVLGGDPKLHARIQGTLDDRIRQPLGPQIEAQVRGLLFQHLEDIPPKAFLFAWLEARFVVHAELDGIHGRHSPQELGQSGLGVGDEVLARHAPDQAGDGRFVPSSAPGTPPPCTPPR